MGWRGRGGEGKKKQGKGRIMGMGRDGDGMVYVYMIVQMSTNIRDSQTRKSESFLWEKNHHVIRRKRGLVQDFFQLISWLFDIGISRSRELAHLIQPQLS